MFGTRYLSRTLYQVLGTNHLVQSTWHQVLVTKYLVPSTWYQVLATKYLVPSPRYQVRGTEYSDMVAGSLGLRSDASETSRMAAPWWVYEVTPLRPLKSSAT